MTMMSQSKPFKRPFLIDIFRKKSRLLTVLWLKKVNKRTESQMHKRLGVNPMKSESESKIFWCNYINSGEITPNWCNLILASIPSYKIYLLWLSDANSILASMTLNFPHLIDLRIFLLSLIFWRFSFLRIDFWSFFKNLSLNLFLPEFYI